MSRSIRIQPLRRRLLLILAGSPLAALSGPAPVAPATLKVAVVGGLALCGVWPRLSERAGRALELRLQTVVAAPKEDVVPAFTSGEADLLLIHGSDAALALLASGNAAPLRAWALNEHVIVGPPTDPAGVRKAADGAEAMWRIAAAGAPFVAFRDPGSHAVVSALWRKAGVRPGRWVFPDAAASPREILLFAAERQAYTVVGHIPVAFGKMPSGGLEVLLAGDPAMRRVYVAIEPGPAHPATSGRRAMARRLADYLLSPAGQADLVAADQDAGGPWVYPLPTDGHSSGTIPAALHHQLT